MRVSDRNGGLRNEDFSWRFRDVFQYSVWIERIQASRSLPRPDISLVQCSSPCKTVQVGKVLFTNYVDASSIPAFDLVTIGCFQGCKRPNIAGLQFMRSISRQAV